MGYKVNHRVIAKIITFCYYDWLLLQINFEVTKKINYCPQKSNYPDYPRIMLPMLILGLKKGTMKTEH